MLAVERIPLYQTAEFWSQKFRLILKLYTVCPRMEVTGDKHFILSWGQQNIIFKKIACGEDKLWSEIVYQI